MKDPRRIFILKLTIATGWTLEYIESLPESIISEYIALNSLMPFTHDAQAYRDGVTASILWNKDVQKKKDLRSPHEIYPYLKPGTPDWLKDELVKKLEGLIKSAEMRKMYSIDSYNVMINDIVIKTKEQIDIEKKATKIDFYRISELNKLISTY